MRKLYFLFLPFLLFQFNSKAQSYKKIWVSLKEDSVADYFYLNDMAVDVNGNTFMCGYQAFPGAQYYETHFILVKINADGKFGWKRSFDNLNDSIDEAIAVDVDTLGNVYVTGKRIDTFCNICTYNTKISDIITMKYDANGNRLWLNRYHDSDYILAEPTDIIVSKDGTLVVTANEERYVLKIGTYVTKMIIQKISKNGKTLWLRKRKDVLGNSACFDSNKNIFIAGSTNGGNIYQTRKPAIIKYDANGNYLLSSVFNEYEKNGEFYFIHCDAINNVYANGQTDTLAFYNHPRILTAKYSNDGLINWSQKELDHSYTLPHYYGDFKVDSAGNCYVAGRWEKTDYYNTWLTTKYNLSGKQEWQAIYNDSTLPAGTPAGLAVDKNGNIYVSGSVNENGGRRTIASIVYNKHGVLIASNAYTPVGRDNAFPIGIGLDKNENVYVGGSMSFKSSFNGFYIVIKYKLKNNPQNFEYTSVTKPVTDLKLFPNPVSSTMKIIFTTSMPTKNYNLIINDINGNVMLSKQLSITEKIISADIDVSRLKQGIYTTTISNGVNTISKTFIKE